MAQSKTQQLLVKSESLIEEKKYYEYEQKIKTHAARFIATNKNEDAVDLLFGGAARLFQSKEIDPALSLTNMALGNIKDTNTNFDQLHKRKFLELFGLIPYSELKLKLGLSVLKSFYSKEQDRDISLTCAEEAMRNGDFHLAQKFIIRCNDSNQQAVTLLREWIKTAESLERDLYVARFILLKIAIGRFADGKFVYEAFRKEVKTPLLNFIGMLIKAVEIKSEKAFEALIDGYEPSYQRDPTFIKLLRKIGGMHFGMATESTEGIFSSFFKFLTA